LLGKGGLNLRVVKEEAADKNSEEFKIRVFVSVGGKL